ncbi:LexA repressor [Legionella massiliensis]|uniref:LexA repressor n=1 Tax=Legionella massiliensis TaxID=1034943 RepID=A0A078KUC0_9GAMM|nr:translesion error-prone DNA polymerase V autoproteolytic subunit [Legionella massiliensis]CDZ76587.1 LexA repressor [Legionella massiliensis]CEE12325.1 LexA repressor [Legionella massiliensis]
MVKGGSRPGAGRPKGGRYGESTKQIRVPISRVEEVFAFLDKPMLAKLPLYASSVRAGFPSPADDYIEMHIDLNEHLIQHQASTFIVRASGDSMTGAGIQSGDLLIVDRSLTPTHGKIVIAAVNGELTVKRLSSTQGRIQLLPDNERYPPIDISEDLEMVIWGVVTFVIHQAD